MSVLFLQIHISSSFHVTPLIKIKTLAPHGNSPAELQKNPGLAQHLPRALPKDNTITWGAQVHLSAERL